MLCRAIQDGQVIVKSPGRKWQLVPVFLHGKFHGQRSLVCYSPGGHRKSDMTEQLSSSSKATVNDKSKEAKKLSRKFNGFIE